MMERLLIANRGIIVQRSRVRAAIHRVDPDNSIEKKCDY